MSQMIRYENTRTTAAVDVSPKCRSPAEVPVISLGTYTCSLCVQQRCTEYKRLTITCPSPRNSRSQITLVLCGLVFPFNFEKEIYLPYVFVLEYLYY